MSRMLSTNDCVPAGTFAQLIAGDVPSPGAAPSAAWLYFTGIWPPSGNPATVRVIAGAAGPPARWPPRCPGACAASAAIVDNAIAAIMKHRTRFMLSPSFSLRCRGRPSAFAEATADHRSLDGGGQASLAAGPRGPALPERAFVGNAVYRRRRCASISVARSAPPQPYVVRLSSLSGILSAALWPACPSARRDGPALPLLSRSMTRPTSCHRRDDCAAHTPGYRANRDALREPEATA
jgi:hypothetical protein